MKYVIHAIDIGDGLSIRNANREKHVEYVKSQTIPLLLAGPLMSEEKSEPMGTVLIVEADSMEDAEKFAQNDPYYKAGLFEEIKITAINITVNNMT